MLILTNSKILDKKSLNSKLKKLEYIKVKFENGKRRIYLKVWEINVGRIKLYLMDSVIDINND